MKREHSVLSVKEIRDFHAFRKRSIRKRLREFSAVKRSDYFYELVYCLLTPQSSARNAERVVGLLRTAGFREHPIDPEPVLHRPDCYIRFHRTKAKHLLAVKEQWCVIADQMSSRKPGEEQRAWLVKNVAGLGWKESSHFLRNIGFRNLAILDRHILRNLVRVGVLRKLPVSLTPRMYLAIERKFMKFACEIGIPMDELDLLFWSMETGEILK